MSRTEFIILSRREPLVDLLSIMNHGTAVVHENDSAVALRQCAEVLVRTATTYAGFGFVAASPQAERVLGAAMMLEPTIHGCRNGPSIIFDINYASGTLLARAARKLRDNGNQSSLVGLVLNPLVETGPEICIAELDVVHVECGWESSEQCQSSVDSSVELACRM